MQLFYGEVLQYQRTEYGKQIVQSLSAQLNNEYGLGFSKRNLLYMMQFAKVFPEQDIEHLVSQNAIPSKLGLLTVDNYR